METWDKAELLTISQREPQKFCMDLSDCLCLAPPRWSSSVPAWNLEAENLHFHPGCASLEKASFAKWQKQYLKLHFRSLASSQNILLLQNAMQTSQWCDCLNLGTRVLGLSPAPHTMPKSRARVSKSIHCTTWVRLGL